MPSTASETRADMAITALNADKNVHGGQTVTIELHLDTGVTLVPEDIYDALETLYGSGKVTAQTDTVAGNRWRLKISA